MPSTRQHSPSTRMYSLAFLVLGLLTALYTGATQKKASIAQSQYSLDGSTEKSQGSKFALAISAASNCQDFVLDRSSHSVDVQMEPADPAEGALSGVRIQLEVNFQADIYKLLNQGNNYQVMLSSVVSCSGSGVDSLSVKTGVDYFLDRYNEEMGSKGVQLDLSDQQSLDTLLTENLAPFTGLDPVALTVDAASLLDYENGPSSIKTTAVVTLCVAYQYQ